MAGFDMRDYVDVAERIAEFSAKYPDGSLQSELTPLERDGVLVGWLCRAYAYRTADDLRPGVGHAVEPVPGKTPYTRDSEAMNAETSAWGRAIIALGFRTKKIASQQEVSARQDPAPGNAGPARQARKKPEAKKAVTGSAAGTVAGASSPSEAPASAASAVERDNQDQPRFVSEDQRLELFKLVKEVGVSSARYREILEYVTGRTEPANIPADKYQAVVEAVKLEAVPFG